MSKSTRILTTALLILIAGTAMCAANTTADVCASGCMYDSIQAAIDDASDGDTIIVGDGIYNENVIVNKEVVIESLNGPSKTGVTALNPDSHTFRITADDVVIVGFTISGATGTGCAGIYIDHNPNAADHPNNAFVYNTYITGNRQGVKIWASTNNVIMGSSIVENSQVGVYLLGAVQACSNLNTITSTNIERNGELQADGSYKWQVINSNAGEGKMEYNYWGTDNESIIENSIRKSGRQCYDVDFDPIKDSRIPDNPDNPVPELPTVMLMVIGMIGLIGLTRYKPGE